MKVGDRILIYKMNKCKDTDAKYSDFPDKCENKQRPLIDCDNDEFNLFTKDLTDVNKCWFYPKEVTHVSTMVITKLK